MPERQSRGLPQRSGRAFAKSLDSLTDTAVRPIHPPTGTPGSSDTSVSSGTSDTPTRVPTTASSAPQATQARVARQHVKLRGDLADSLRDAVWFLSEHGRPRVQLGEVLDEAVGEWLRRATAEHNEGQPFPHKGRLR